MVLVWFTRRRRDLPFAWMFWMFGAFIIGCGTTHLMEVITTYTPVYRLSGIIKLLTAGVSVATAAALVPLVPKALSLRSPKELAHEVQERKRIEEELRRAQDELESRIQARTGALVKTNKVLQQQKEQLRAALEFNEAVMANMGEGLYTVDRGGLVTHVNPAAEQLFGWTSAELRGRKMHEVTHHHYPDGRPFPAAEGAGLKVLQQGISLTNHEDVFIRKDGSFFPVIFSAAPLRAQGEIIGLVVVFRDVTAQKQAGEALRQAHKELEERVQTRTAALATANQVLQAEIKEREQAEESLRQFEQRFRLLVEGVQDYAIFMLDPEGRVMTWNAGAERFKGYRADEIIGQHFSRFYPEEALARDWPAHELEVARAEGRFEDEGWRLRKDGSRFWANVVITTLRDEAGDLKGFAKVTRDLTERRLAEEKMKSYAAQLQKRNQELDQFASVASHDLQEPLRKIQAFGNRLQSKCGAALDEQGREYLERMNSAAVRMRSLITDLLALSRLTTNARPFRPVNLAAVAKEVVSDLEGRLQESGGRVEIGTLPVLDADQVQMRQLLQNLIGNALKFHRPGVPPLVRVEGKLRRVARGARIAERTSNSGSLLDSRSSILDPRSSEVEITVEDNGIGFAEKYLDRIFEVFQRLHGRNEYEGTGMGLAICRKIAERHGGRITATSKPGQGATFIITLPARQPYQETSDDGETQTDYHSDGG